MFNLCFIRSKSGTRAVRNVQRFVYDEGYIACHCDLDLVLGVISTADGQGSEVALVKRKKDELSQMWIVKPNGYVGVSVYYLLCQGQWLEGHERSLLY